MKYICIHSFSIMALSGLCFVLSQFFFVCVCLDLSFSNQDFHIRNRGSSELPGEQPSLDHQAPWQLILRRSFALQLPGAWCQVPFFFTRFLVDFKTEHPPHSPPVPPWLEGPKQILYFCKENHQTCGLAVNKISRDMGIG